MSLARLSAALFGRFQTSSDECTSVAPYWQADTKECDNHGFSNVTKPDKGHH